MKPETKAKIKKVLKITGLVTGGAVVGIFIGKATNGKGNTNVTIPEEENTGLINEKCEKITDDDFETISKFMIDFLVWSCENNGGKFVVSDHANEDGLTDKLLVAEIIDVEPGATKVSAE